MIAMPGKDPSMLPVHDLNGICGLPETIRRHIRTYLYIFHQLDQAKSLTKELKRQAETYSHRKGDGFGYSARTLQRRYSQWRDAGRDWRVLVPEWNNGDNRLGLPKQAFEEFVKFWVSFVSQTSRDADGVKAAYDLLVHEHWLAGKRIPGFGDIANWHEREFGRPWVPTRIIRDRKRLLPRGMTYDTLLRIYHEFMPKDERMLMHRGFHAAHSLLPDQVLRDRSQARWMEFIVFDDHRPDIQVIAQGESGQPDFAYPQILVAQDLGSSFIIESGVLPRLTRDEDKTRMGFNREHMQFLLCKIFQKWGLPEGYPVTLLVENAVAAISTADELAILEAFGGRVRVQRTGVSAHRLLGSGFNETVGQSWDKSWIESWFRAFETRLAMSKGATGRRFDYDPGELPGRIAEAKRLLKSVGNDLAEARQFEMPLLWLDEFEDRMHRIIDILQLRTDHKLQGFDQVTEWLDQSGRWLPIEQLSALPPAERQQECVQMVTRPECPAERAVKLYKANPTKRVDPAVYVHLMLSKRELKCERGRWVWRMPKGRDDLIFRDSENALCSAEFAAKNDGAKFLCYLNDDKDLLHITRDGAYLGAIARQLRVDVTDREAIREEAARVATARNQSLSRVRSFLVDQEADLEAARAHNDGVIERWDSAQGQVAGAIQRTEKAISKSVANAPARQRQRDRDQANRWAEQAELARAQDDDVNDF